jgi:nucleotide-binding universal stress UspA family protein
MYTKLLLAVDGSPQSLDAAHAAAEMAKAIGATVHVVHVVEEMVGAKRAGEFTLEAADAATEIMSEAAAVLVAEHVDHTTEIRHVRIGNVAKEIITAAHAASADLIVMGTRGTTTLGHLLLGSTAYKVLHLSDLPVLVMPSHHEH